MIINILLYNLDFFTIIFCSARAGEDEQRHALDPTEIMARGAAAAVVYIAVCGVQCLEMVIAS